MTWEPRPVPDPNPETADYWAAAADGRLVVSECTDCGRLVFMPRSYCPDCFGETELCEVSGEGTVYTYSVTSAVEDWPESDLPLVVAYVELAEGPRMLTNIRGCDPAAVSIGMAVEVAFVDTEADDVAIPVFEPAD
jgi:uncharacterized OB-fold protein